MPDLGDYTTPQLQVSPFDGTTAATLTVHAPDGTSTPLTGSTTDGGNHWTAAAVAFSQAGWWLLTWAVTGTGAGTEHERIYASPAPTGPAWAPDLVAVAKYVPRRTVVAAANGYGQPVSTFTAETHPDATAVEGLITDAVAWVQAKVTNPAEATYGLARAAAAQRAAGMVELGYPDNRDDLSTADRLLAEAKTARDDLDTANAAVAGEDPEDPSANLLPLWSFPAASPAWDYPIG